MPHSGIISSLNKLWFFFIHARTNERVMTMTLVNRHFVKSLVLGLAFQRQLL
jgi:hypothetical protein